MFFYFYKIFWIVFYLRYIFYYIFFKKYLISNIEPLINVVKISRNDFFISVSFIFLFTVFYIQLHNLLQYMKCFLITFAVLFIIFIILFYKQFFFIIPLKSLMKAPTTNTALNQTAWMFNVNWKQLFLVWKCVLVVLVMCRTSVSWDK